MLVYISKRFQGVAVLYDKAPWVFLGVGVGLSLAVFALGKYFEPDVPGLAALPPFERFTVHAGHVAQICLVGGIVAAITRLFALTGYFRVALSEIVETNLTTFETKVRDITEVEVRKIVETQFSTFESTVRDITEAEVRKIVETQFSTFESTVRDITEAEVRKIVETQFNTFESKVRNITEAAVVKDEAARANTLEEVWQDITRKILLPGFEVKTQDDRRFVESVNASLRRMIDERVNYYVSGMNRIITLKSFDAATGAILIEDSATYRVVPFNPADTVQFKMRFIASPKQTIAEYGIQDVLFKVDGVNMIPVMEAEPSRANERIVPVQLRGKSVYRIERITTSHQRLDSDPYYMLAPDFICMGTTTVAVRVQTPQISAVFEEVGVKDAFAPQFDHAGADPDVMQYACQTTLLPEQGFVIAMTRKK